MIFKILIFLGLIQIALNSEQRRGKLFSLFNIVTFRNEQCSSAISSSGGGQRTGQCFTSGECASRSGTGSGSCASGFGVCCVFIITSGTVTQNCTYLQNQGFPTTFTGTTAPTFTIQKCSSGVCAVRLDFESFTINGPADTTEGTGGACNTDSLVLTSSSGEVYPTICGQNTGQHVYVELGNNAGNTATLTFAFTGTGTRMFDIKVTQIPCGSTIRPYDEGCFQYFTGTQGTFTTFNFLDSTTSHLANQRYTACFRQEVGYCCIEYQVCDDPNSFTINTQGANANKGRIDEQCDGAGNGLVDYVVINGASSDCSGLTPTVQSASKICGTVFFPAITTAGGNVAICDCTQPFQVGIFTDNANDAPNQGLSRGVCLDWKQIAC